MLQCVIVYTERERGIENFTEYLIYRERMCNNHSWVTLKHCLLYLVTSFSSSVVARVVTYYLQLLYTLKGKNRSLAPRYFPSSRLPAVTIEILLHLQNFKIIKYAGACWNFVKLTKFHYVPAYLRMGIYALAITNTVKTAITSGSICFRQCIMQNLFQKRDGRE